MSHLAHRLLRFLSMPTLQLSAQILICLLELRFETHQAEQADENATRSPVSLRKSIGNERGPILLGIEDIAGAGELPVFSGKLE
mmetsp:Transcript_18080/g.31721  ORF Transcript_18080/g.31721 Transcript_18080/m.31721 type:complete len:84 (+) Transcript_18080:2090-2341(+)